MWEEDTELQNAEVLFGSDLEEEDESRLQFLREKKKRKIKKTYKTFSLREEMPVSFENKPDRELRVVLVGKTGSGKSATGNSIIGSGGKFRLSKGANSETRTIESATRELKDGSAILKIIDTPGLLDTRKDVNVPFELAKITHNFSRGIHVFCFIIKATDYRFTEHEREIVKTIKKSFGDSVFKYCLLILTHGDAAFKEDTLKSYIHDQSNQTPKFQEFIAQFNDHIVAVDNSTSSEFETLFRSQFLINHILQVFNANEGACYSHEVFSLAQKFEKKTIDKLKKLTKKYTSNTVEVCDEEKDFETWEMVQPQSQQAQEMEQELRELQSFNAELKQQNETLEREKEHEKQKSKESQQTVQKQNQKMIATDKQMKAEKELHEKIPKLVPKIIESLTKQELKEAKETNFLSLTEKAEYYFKTEFTPETQRYYLDSYDNIKEYVDKYITDHEQSLTALATKIHGCFPADAMIICKKRGQVEISEVLPGDKILTLGKDGLLIFEDVFMLSHADNTSCLLYIEIKTDHGNVLRVSPDHYLHVGDVGEFLPASDVKVGDMLFTVHRDHVSLSRVVKIDTVWGQGVYCPHTMGGSILVDNVLASCYTSILQPRLMHALLYPIRVLYNYVPPAVFTSIIQYDNVSGMPALLQKYQSYFFKVVHRLPNILK